MNIKIVILSLLFLFISACSFTNNNTDTPPDWINGQSKKYARALYLTGQGIALTVADAKDRARSDLAKQFEVAIREQSLQSQTFTSEQVEGESIQALDQKISRQLLTSTRRSLQAVEIAEQWHDPDHDMNYALAVLSRNKARHQFEQQLRTLDQQARQRLQQAEAESALLIRAALVQQAINSQQQRIVVQSSLQVVDLSGRGNPPELSMAELIRSRDSLLKQISIQPAASGSKGIELLKILSGAIAGAGFSVASSGNTNYQLKIQTLLDPAIEQDGLYWLRGTMQITLIDSSGNNVGVQRWPLKVSSIDLNRARQRLLSKVDQLLKDELREVLLAFAVKP